MEGCRDRYGDAFTIRFLHEGTTVLLSHPDDVKTLFTADPTIAHAGEGRNLMRAVFGNDSLFCLDEESHASQRRLLLPPFHGERLAGYTEMIAEVAASEITAWPIGQPMRLAPRCRALTLEVILRAMFGLDAARAAPLREATERLLKLFSSLPRLVPIMLLGPDRVPRLPYIRNVMASFDARVLEQIARRMRDKDANHRADILSVLVSASRENGALTDPSAIRDQLVTILVAGYETTSTAVAWAFERLANAPHAMTALEAEIAAEKQDYLEAVVKEVLRMRPVIPVVGRLIKAPLELRTCTVPSGTIASACIYLAHRRPEIYPEPDRFMPERFLGTTPGTYTWIPFGGGVRRCLGASFAMVEMRTVLRVVVERLRIRPADNEAETMKRRSITLAPGRECRVIAERQH